MGNSSERGFIPQIANGPLSTHRLTTADGQTSFAITQDGLSGKEVHVVTPDGTDVYYQADGTALDAIRRDGTHDLQYAIDLLKEYTSLD